MALSDKHRRFCDGLMAGLSQAEAYKAAGYKCDGAHYRKAAARLATNVDVISELSRRRELARKAGELSDLDIIRDLYAEAHDRDMGSAASRVAALMGIAKCRGMVTTKRVHSGELSIDLKKRPDPRGMTLEQLHREIAELEAGGAGTHRDGAGELAPDGEAREGPADDRPDGPGPAG